MDKGSNCRGQQHRSQFVVRYFDVKKDGQIDHTHTHIHTKTYLQDTDNGGEVSPGAGYERNWMFRGHIYRSKLSGTLQGVQPICSRKIGECIP